MKKSSTQLSFEESDLYKEAYKKYLDEKVKEDKYQALLSPTNVIIDSDACLLFYDVDTDTLDQYLKEFVRLYEERGKITNDFPRNLGYDTPRKCTYRFMGNTYFCILLRYDGDDTLPKKWSIV